MKLVGAFAITTVAGAVVVSAILWLTGAFDASQKRAEALEPAPVQQEPAAEAPGVQRRFVPLNPKHTPDAGDRVEVQTTQPSAASDPTNTADEKPDDVQPGPLWPALDRLIQEHAKDGGIVALRVAAGDEGIRTGRSMLLNVALQQGPESGVLLRTGLDEHGEFSLVFSQASDGPMIGAAIEKPLANLADVIQRIQSIHKGRLLSLQAKRFTHLPRAASDGSFVNVRLASPCDLWEACIESGTGGAQYWYYDASSLEVFTVPQD